MIPLLGTYIYMFNLNQFIMEDLINIYSDTELTVSHLKNILADNGIESMIKNDFESGVSAGFVAGTPSSVDLFVFSKDAHRARPIVDKFLSELKK
ncbi:putative signal transducing protein [Carboxylicivirga sp. RSCT41]|uniref:putative signal transducing protein n=1 Tax=Carboxylicivirga agarovorans TaxID=3417570 RepID=UPI003D349134